MTVITREHQEHVSVPASTLFKAIGAGHHNVPQFLSQYVKTSETVEGSGSSIGAIVKITFGGEYGYVKHKIEMLDENKLAFAFTTFEGNPWIEGVEKVYFEITFVPSSDGGSTVKVLNKWYTNDSKNAETEINAIDQKIAGLAKTFENYCLIKAQA